MNAMYKIELNGTLEVEVGEKDKPSEIVRKCITADMGRYFFGMLDALRGLVLYRKCDHCKRVGTNCTDCPFYGTVRMNSAQDTGKTRNNVSCTTEYKERENDR